MALLTAGCLVRPGFTVRGLKALPLPHADHRRWAIHDARQRCSRDETRWHLCAGGSVALPPTLEKDVAVVNVGNPKAQGGGAEAYILGISHVSKKSCENIRNLIDAVQPDVVMMELCKDRCGLLSGREYSTQIWHTRRISIAGADFTEDWPSEEELMSLLNVRTGHPVSIADIEDDVVALLSTGLFRKGKPGFRKADMLESAAFMVKPAGGETAVQTVPALGEVQFTVEERVLPPIVEVDVRMDSSLKGFALNEDALEALKSEAMGGDADGSSLGRYLQLRKGLLSLLAEAGLQEGVVVCRGEDRGKLEIVLRAQRPDDRPLVTGLEEGAEGGSGWGIDRFRPSRKPVELSSGMLIPRAALKKLTEPDGGDAAELCNNGQGGEQAQSWAARGEQTKWREWDEVRRSENPEDEDKFKFDVLETFGDVLTGLYGKYQGEAGRKSGMDPGAAWRACIEAAAAAGVRQVHLGDSAQELSKVRLAESMFTGMIWRFVAAAGLLGLVVTGLVKGVPLDVSFLDANLQPAFAPTVLTAGSTGVGLLLWPILGPLYEIYRLSEMSAEEIEEAVSLKEPIQSHLDQPLKLFGEDALLDWPGAMEPIIHMRDTHMANNLRAAAIGENGEAPAYILDRVKSGWVYRYMMPNGTESPHVVEGLGDGQYMPLEAPQRVVAVVGSAHVRGMCKALDS